VLWGPVSTLAQPLQVEGLAAVAKQRAEQPGPAGGWWAQLGSVWKCTASRGPSDAELTCVDVAQDAERDGDIDLVYDEFLSQGAEKSI